MNVFKTVKHRITEPSSVQTRFIAKLLFHGQRFSSPEEAIGAYKKHILSIPSSE